jgi:hypothetical protein
MSSGSRGGGGRGGGGGGPHAFFGAPVCQTPRSRLYQVKASFLAAHFPQDAAIQRQVEHPRVGAIIAAMTEDPDAPVHFPGTVCIFDFEDRPCPPRFSQRGIFDGQHRTAALGRIVLQRQSAEIERGEEPVWDTDVVIEVFPVRSAADVRRLFVEVNRAQPVLPYVVTFVRRAHRDLADEAVKLLVNHKSNWASEMVREPVTTPRSPHVKPSALANALVMRGFVARHEGKTSEQLMKELLRINRALGERPALSWPLARRGSHNRHYYKAKRHDFYLGLDADFAWIEAESSLTAAAAAAAPAAGPKKNAPAARPKKKTARTGPSPSSDGDTESDDDDDAAAARRVAVSPKFKVGQRVIGHTSTQGDFRATVVKIKAATEASNWEPTYDLLNEVGAFVEDWAQEDTQPDK